MSFLWFKPTGTQQQAGDSRSKGNRGLRQGHLQDKQTWPNAWPRRTRPCPVPGSQQHSTPKAAPHRKRETACQWSFQQVSSRHGTWAAQVSWGYRAPVNAHMQSCPQKPLAQKQKPKAGVSPKASEGRRDSHTQGPGLMSRGVDPAEASLWTDEHPQELCHECVGCSVLAPSLTADELVHSRGPWSCSNP